MKKKSKYYESNSNVKMESIKYRQKYRKTSPYNKRRPLKIKCYICKNTNYYTINCNIKKEV